MYYSELFFKKDIYSITEKDVIEFFQNSVEETSILEFKSGKVSLEKVYCEVAALHNSQGGLLIVGSPEPKKDITGKEFFEGELTRSNFRNKDWLYQKIYSKISPPPINLKIHDVKCEEGIIQIIDIPKSVNPPHQCLDDGKYYIRFETETKFAPHGLIEALFNRRKEPVVDFNLQNTLENVDSNYPYNLTLKVFNISDIPIINAKHQINFYNVDQVFSHHYNKDLRISNYTVTITKTTDTFQQQNLTLVKGMDSKFKYIVHHFNMPFFITAHTWGDNMNLIGKGILISPNDNCFLKFELTGDIFKDVIKQIENFRERMYELDNMFDYSGFKKILNLITQNELF